MLSRYRCRISLFRLFAPWVVIGGFLRLFGLALGVARACRGLRPTGACADDVAAAAGSGA